MAYTATITKSGVSKLSGTISNISVTVSISDGTEEVFNKTYSKKYNANSTNLDAFKSEILAEVRDDWDKYVAEQNVFTSAIFNAAVEDMQTSANAYLNQ
jgi:hypothetical protein